MSRTANSRRFDATTSRKLGREPADAGLVEHALQRLDLLLGGEHRAAHQPLQIGAFGDQRVETVEVGLDRVERMLPSSASSNKRGRIAARHAGYDGFFACHVDLLSGNSAGSAPSRTAGAKPLKFKWDFEFSEDHGALSNPTKIAGLLTHGQRRCNNGGPRKYCGKSRRSETAPCSRWPLNWAHAALCHEGEDGLAIPTDIRQGRPSDRRFVMAWFYLLLAGLLEVGWAIGLKYTDGFTRLVPSLWTGASMVLSLFFSVWR